MRRVYAGVAAILGWFAVVGQYLDRHADSVASTIDYLSLFTILSNILVAAVFTSVALASSSRLGKWCRSPPVAAAAALYITVTGLVYFFLLRHLYNPTGWSYVWDVIFHYIVPPAYVLFWLVLAPKGTLRFALVPALLAFPLVYAVWTLAHGAVSGFYPYPFVDVSNLGYPRVFLTIAEFVVFFALVGSLFVGLDRAIGGWRLREAREGQALTLRSD